MKNINAPFHLVKPVILKRSMLTVITFLAGTLALLPFKYLKDHTPKQHLTGVPALSGLLDKSKFTMSSIIKVDVATTPPTEDQAPRPSN